MTIDDKIRDERLQDDVDRKVAKNMNILQVKKYYPIIKVK